MASAYQPSESFIDYYQVLGVTPTATVAVIKQAYRQAAKKAHPDAGGSADAMDRLNDAYGVLGDADKRAIFDQERTQHYAPPPVQSAASAATSPQVQSEAQINAARQELRRLRVAYARHSGLEVIRWSLVAGAGFAALTWLFGGMLDTWASRLMVMSTLGGAGFGLVFGITSITDPDFRLVLLDFSWQNRQWPRRDWWLILTAQLVTGCILGGIFGWWLLRHASLTIF